MRTIAPAIPRCPPQLHTLPGKGKKNPIPRCPPMNVPGKGKKNPIPRCPPALIGISLAPGKGGKTVGENVRDFFESFSKPKAKGGSGI
ncbi:MAG: hypothetical protein ACO1OB_14265 [Archangium sp.]